MRNLLQLDVDYVNPDDPSDANRDPAAASRAWNRCIGGAHALARLGVRTLVLMTGRGYHFTARAPLGTPLRKR